MATAAAVPATTSPIRVALMQILCHSSATYERVEEYPGRAGVGGLFSQLNFLAQRVYDHTMQGQRPAADFHARMKLMGYGGGPMTTHFHPVPCGRGSQHTAAAPSEQSVRNSLATLRAASRYLIVSHLLALLYRPRAAKELDAFMPAEAHSIGSIDLAIHVRRGDKITEARPGEKIKVWDVEGILEEVPRNVAPNGSVLIASDDDAFTQEVAHRLRALGYLALRQGNEQQRFDAQNRSIEAAQVCDATCVLPLLALKQLFSHSRRLMLSTKSNLGSHLLSSWAAANGDAAPALVDLDGSIRAGGIHVGPGGRYFCELPWGSRRGLCKATEKTCDLPHMAHRTFCKTR